MSVAIAERFQATVRIGLGDNAVKKLAGITGLGLRRCEDMLSPSSPRPPTAETLARTGELFGKNWLHFVVCGGDEDIARQGLEIRRVALEAEIHRINAELRR